MVGTDIELDARDALVRLARRHNAGQLVILCSPCFAEKLRTLAPGLRGLDDTIVYARFRELCEDVARVDGVRDLSIEWCQVVDDPREDAEQAAVGLLDDTLAKLTTPPGATT